VELRLADVLKDIRGGRGASRPVPQSITQAIVRDVVIDSRLATPGSLFVALGGATVDGHAFVGQAFDAGASAALVARDRWRADVVSRAVTVIDADDDAAIVAEAAGHPFVIIVADPLASLHAIAAAHRRRHQPTVIGITGSVGKTSTKEVMATVLARRFRTLKTPRSYNSAATLPLVLLHLQPTHEVAVIEMGMYLPGDISRLAALAQPQIGVVTNVGPSHLERVGSIEGITRAKSELPASLPGHGVAILNADDHRVRGMADITRARVVLYGHADDADVRGVILADRGLDGLRVRIAYDTHTFDCGVRLAGAHHLATILSVTAVARTLGMTPDEISAGLGDVAGDIRLQTSHGARGEIIIDDTWNAAPSSMIAALGILAGQSGRRVAVLGDMREIGAVEVEEHRRVGAAAVGCADWLITCGGRGRWIGEGAHDAGMPDDRIIHCGELAAAIAAVRQIAGAGDHVLVKGSRAMAMEQIVDALRAGSSRA
jgi:UDP-N-acetylmuramoyl-tripeptide--D-alanyl-D-alanine ligase